MMMNFNIDGEEFIPQMITRREFDLDEWKEKLIEFDKSFFHYFEQLTYLILPQNYQSAQYDFELFLNHCHARMEFRRNEMEEYERRFNENFNG